MFVIILSLSTAKSRDGSRNDSNDLEKRTSAHSYVSMDRISLDEMPINCPLETSSKALAQLCKGTVTELQQVPMDSRQSNSELPDTQTTDQAG